MVENVGSEYQTTQKNSSVIENSSCSYESEEYISPNTLLKQNIEKYLNTNDHTILPQII